MRTLMCPECHQHICPSVFISHLHWMHRWSKAIAKELKWRMLLEE